jgi:hypothetical protein
MNKNRWCTPQARGWNKRQEAKEKPQDNAPNQTLSRLRQRFWFQFLCIILYNYALNSAFYCLCNERSSSIKAASFMPSNSTILQPNLPLQHNFKFKHAINPTMPSSLHTSQFHMQQKENSLKSQKKLDTRNLPLICSFSLPLSRLMICVTNI